MACAKRYRAVRWHLPVATGKAIRLPSLSGATDTPAVTVVGQAPMPIGSLRTRGSILKRMTYSFDGRRTVLVLQKGEELVEVLRRFANDSGLRAATVSGIGGALEAELGFYDLEAQEYRWKTFGELQEIASLQGTITADEAGELVLHLHGVLSDWSYRSVGGHIKRLVVGGTCELVVESFGKELIRRHDNQTGLSLLNV